VDDVEGRGAIASLSRQSHDGFAKKAETLDILEPAALRLLCRPIQYGERVEKDQRGARRQLSVEHRNLNATVELQRCQTPSCKQALGLVSRMTGSNDGDAVIELAQSLAQGGDHVGSSRRPCVRRKLGGHHQDVHRRLSLPHGTEGKQRRNLLTSAP
jgi:hypothetical protein